MAQNCTPAGTSNGDTGQSQLPRGPAADLRASTEAAGGNDALFQRPYRVRAAPLLWLALPFAAGIAAAYTLGPPARSALLPLLLTALLAAIGVIAAGNGRPRLWAALYLATVFLCGVAYTTLREPLPGPHLEVPREAMLELRVERIFTSEREDGYISGIGRVQNGPDYLPGLAGNRVSFGLFSSPRFGADNPPLVSGSVLLVKGRLSDFESPLPPMRHRRLPRSATDEQRAAAAEQAAAAERSRQGFTAFVRGEGARYALDSGSVIAMTDTGSTWRQLCERMKSRLKTALQAGADSPQTQRLANIGIAMLLGETRVLSPDDRQAFVFSGTMHLFAVSGLHVVLIAAAFAAVGECLGVRRSRVAIAGIVLLWVYVQVVGAPPSAVRAWWMSSLFWGALALRRQPSSLSALSASMLILLLIEPRQVLNVGFQLSYSVVAGILLYALPLADALRQWALHRQDKAHLRLRRYPLFPPPLWYRLPLRWQRDFLSLFTISLTGTLYSAPLVLGVFGNFAPGGLLINLLLVPLSFWILCALLIAATFGVAGLLGAASLFNHSAWLLLAFMAWCAGLSLSSPVGFYTGLAWNWPYYGAAVCLALMGASLLSQHSWFEHRRKCQLGLVPAVWLLATGIGLMPLS